MSSAGNISFAARATYSLGTNAWSVAIADVDGDGKADIEATDNYGLSIFRNTSTPGNISLAARSTFSTGVAPPYNVVLGDLTGDGKPDLVVATSGGYLSVWQNNSSIGNIILGSRVDYPAGGSNPTMAAACDLDGDGIPDLVAARWNTNDVCVFRSTIGQPPAAPLSLIASTGNSQVTLKWNKNTEADFLKYRIFMGTDSVNVSLKDSTSASISDTTKIITGLTNGTTYYFRVSALDSARLESSKSIAVSATPIASTIPTITSFSPTSGPIGTTVTITGTNFSTTAANNIVYFGSVGAVVATASANSLNVLAPTGATYAPISVTNISTGLTVYSTKSFIVTFPSSQIIDASSFTSKVDFASGTGANGVAIGDLDGDGKPDLVVVNNGVAGNPGNTISVFRNISESGSITASSFASKVDFTTDLWPYSVVIADVDEDGKPDLVVTNTGSNDISILRNTSTAGSITSGSFASKVDFATGTQPYFVAIGDLDGDGKPDMVVANSYNGTSLGNTVSVLRNTSIPGSITANSFALKVDFTTGSTPVGTAISDVDGDGKPDIVVANYGSNTLSVLRNTTTPGLITASSFATKVDFITGTNPLGIAIGDVDGDGKPDLIVTNSGTGTNPGSNNFSFEEHKYIWLNHDRFLCSKN